MSTSLTDPSLVFAANKALIAAHPAIAKVTQFATDFTADAVKPGTTLKIPVYDGGTAESLNAGIACAILADELLRRP